MCCNLNNSMLFNFVFHFLVLLVTRLGFDLFSVIDFVLKGWFGLGGVLRYKKNIYFLSLILIFFCF